MFKQLVSAFLLILISSSLFAKSTQNYITELKELHTKEHAYPLLSTKYPSITIPMAYGIQKQWVGYLLSQNSKVGYKAGLTSSESQKKFKTNAPIFGVLAPKKQYQNFAIIPKKDFHNLYIEAELGFRFKRSIKKPIESDYILKSLIKECVVVAELADIRLKTPSQAQLSDIIAINSAAASLVIGDAIPLSRIDDLSIELLHNKSSQFKANANDILDGQLAALKWLINATLEKGYSISKDDLFITGALGDMLAAKKGRYVINYGDQASLLFDIY